MTNAQLASGFAWIVVLLLVSLLLVTVVQRRHVSPSETFVILLAGLFVAVAGGLTAMLSIFPLGTFDVDLVRMVLIILRGCATALYGGILLSHLGWPLFMQRIL